MIKFVKKWLENINLIDKANAQIKIIYFLIYFGFVLLFLIMPILFFVVCFMTMYSSANPLFHVMCWIIPFVGNIIISVVLSGELKICQTLATNEEVKKIKKGQFFVQTLLNPITFSILLLLSIVFEIIL